LEPRIEILPEKEIVGNGLKCHFRTTKPTNCGRVLLPSRREIKNNIGSDLYSVEVYEPLYFKNFNPEKEFDKWAVSK